MSIARVRDLHSADDRERFRRSGHWAGKCLFEIVDGFGKTRPDRLAVTDGTRSYSYAELSGTSRRAASALWRLGLGAGGVLAAYLPNTALSPLLHLAANRIGAVYLPIPATWRAAEVVPVLLTARPQVIVVPDEGDDADYAAIVGRATGGFDPSPVVITMTEFERALAMPAVEEREAGYRPDPDAVAHLTPSSGSTGAPKLSALSSENLHSLFVSQICPAYGIGPEDRIGAIAPTGTGSTGYLCGVLCALFVGASSHVLPRWSADAALDLLLRAECTAAAVIPTQLVMMLDRLAEREAAAPRSLRVLLPAGAPLPAPVAQEAERRFGCKALSLYGASEATIPAVLTVEDAEDKRRETVGRVAPGQEFRLVDEAGRAVEQGRPGEIVWRGSSCSYGFYAQPELDEQAWDEHGWFHSGDIGVLDEDGYLSVVGRSKDMILRGGYNVFPAELEAALHEHPAIAEVVLVPVPDERLGERGCAVVVAAEGERPHLASLVGFLERRGIARYKLPEYLVVLDELPRAASSKYDRRRLREIAAASIEPIGERDRAREARRGGEGVRATSDRQRRAFARDELPETEAVRPGVHAIALEMPGVGIPFSLVYLIDGGDGSLHLIDSGMAEEQNWDRLCRQIAEVGGDIGDVASVTLTHMHRDHAGQAARIRAASGAEVRMHRLDALPMRAGLAQLDGDEMEQKLDLWDVPAARRPELRVAGARPIAKGPMVEIDRDLEHGERLSFGDRRMSALHTPGHTAGHLTLVDDAERLVFTGDHVLPRINPGVGLGLRPPGDDPLGDYLESLAMLDGFGEYEACPGHGYRFRGLPARCDEIRAHHSVRGEQVRAVWAEESEPTVWRVAGRVGWTGGFESLQGAMLLSALRQTEMHLRRSA